MTRRRLMTMALVALAASAAGALESDQVFITYDLKIGQNEISGVSRELEWLFIPPDEKRGGRMRLRVPIDSFDSGHPAFDSKLRKAFDSEHHPMLEITGVAREGQLEGTLELAGTVQPITVKLHMERMGGDVVAMASFQFDLRDYGVALEGVDPHMSMDAIVRPSASAKAVVVPGGYDRR